VTEGSLPPEIGALLEENKKLRLENKKLARELKYELANSERNMTRAEARENLSRVITAEKTKLDFYMSTLLSNSPGLILFFNSGGRLVFASDSYLERSGFHVLGLVAGKTYRELLSPVMDEEFLARAERLFGISVSQKRTVEAEHDIDFGNNGDARHYLMQVIPMMEKGGQAEGFMALFYDTTEITRARLEAERARELAEQSTKAKSDFLSRMSHEMRTPMNAIIGMTNIAMGSGDPGRKEYCLEKIKDASAHLLGVINDILDMSKIESGKFEISESAFNFGNMLRRVADVINFRVDEKRQKLVVDMDEKIPQNIVSDEQRLAQVIANLLSNAVKFTPDHGTITMAVRKTAAEGEIPTIRFSVKDTGIGISKEQQSRLFNSFEQADGGISRKFGGTGLGLAISKRIVELMGGQIWIESKLGSGADFIFEIKAKFVDDGSYIPGDAGDAESLSGSDDGIFRGKRVLLAEDIEINCEVLSSLIEHTEVTLEYAEDGNEALGKFTSDPDGYDLILMDVHMPNMGGYEATRRIRASGLNRSAAIPIIAMTANVFREDIERCRAAGMNGHLGKPIDAAAVIAKMKEYLL
jgi:signal transduction histidine kinase